MGESQRFNEEENQRASKTCGYTRRPKNSAYRKLPYYLGPAGVMWIVPLDELEHSDGTLRQQIVVLRFFLRHALVLFLGELPTQTDSDGKVPW